MHPSALYAASHSELVIEVIPVNLIGLRTPFVKASSTYVVEEGKELVEVIPAKEGTSAVVRSNGIQGEAIIGIYSIKSGEFLGRVLVKILPGEMALKYFRAESYHAFLL